MRMLARLSRSGPPRTGARASWRDQAGFTLVELLVVLVILVLYIV